MSHHIVVNIHSSTWSVPSTWKPFILFEKFKPFKKVYKQYIFKTNVPEEVRTQIYSMKPKFFDVTIGNWYHLITRERFTENEVDEMNLSFGEKTINKEILLLKADKDGFYRLVLFVKCPSMYKEYKKIKFVIRLKKRDFAFSSQAINRVCMACEFASPFKHTHFEQQ